MLVSHFNQITNHFLIVVLLALLMVLVPDHYSLQHYDSIQISSLLDTGEEPDCLLELSNTALLILSFSAFFTISAKLPYTVCISFCPISSAQNRAPPA